MKKVHINMRPILDGYGVMGIFKFPYTPSCEPRLTEPAGGVMHSVSLVADFSHRQCSSRFLDTWEECGEGGMG